MPPVNERIERQRREREAQERASEHHDYTTFPPPSVPGVGSKGLVRTHEYTAQIEHKWTSIWKIVGYIAAATAMGFGAAKAIQPDYSKQLQVLQDKLDANEHARQQDQRLVEGTIAGLHLEIELLKRDLHVAVPLEVKGHNDR